MAEFWRTFGGILANARARKAVLLQRKMKDSIIKILGLGIIGWLAWRKLSTLEQEIKDAQEKSNLINQNWQEYLSDKDAQAIDPAEKYLEITPFVEFSNITNNNWVGRFTWTIKNTSPDITFNITRICSNIQICGYTSIFVPGNKDTIVRVNPGSSVQIRSTWQDRQWYLPSDVTAKDRIREVLRSSMDRKFDVLECDCKIWCRGTGSVDEREYVFNGLKGKAELLSGVTKYWSNEGENAVAWE